ncbi:MAG: hypothetical protein EZS28_055699, partial [Streblomastix strix]
MNMSSDVFSISSFVFSHPPIIINYQQQVSSDSSTLQSALQQKKDKQKDKDKDIQNKNKKRKGIIIEQDVRNDSDDSFDDLRKDELKEKKSKGDDSLSQQPLA